MSNSILVVNSPTAQRHVRRPTIPKQSPMSTFCNFLRDHLEDELEEALKEPNQRKIRARIWDIIEEQLVRVENMNAEIKAGQETIRFLRASQTLDPLQEELADMRKDKLALEQALQSTRSKLKRLTAE
ncbi:hypothetical protein CF327_g732 [Tilletia walkeri]|nr:hypothetical protein CF327_g732 [Tilletia walkeri]